MIVINPDRILKIWRKIMKKHFGKVPVSKFYKELEADKNISDGEKSLYPNDKVKFIGSAFDDKN